MPGAWLRDRRGHCRYRSDGASGRQGQGEGTVCRVHGSDPVRILNQVFAEQFSKVDREQETADNRAMAIKRAKQAVQFATDFLAQEIERAAICVKYGVCTLLEADAIEDDAQEKLEDAQEDLAAILSADVLPPRDPRKGLSEIRCDRSGQTKAPKPFRVHAGIANVTFEEILRYSRKNRKKARGGREVPILSSTDVFLQEGAQEKLEDAHEDAAILSADVAKTLSALR